MIQKNLVQKKEDLIEEFIKKLELKYHIEGL